MTLFFLVVGLEAKRELDLGELRERHAAGDPGRWPRSAGWRCAVAIYLAINAGGDGAHGWGAAISTDTALALGALALVAPAAARPACACSCSRSWSSTTSWRCWSSPSPTPSTIVGRRRWRSRSRCSACCSRCAAAGRWRGPAAVLVGVGIWFAMFESGVDPVIAGLAIGLVTSAYPPARDDLERATELARSFREQPTPELADSAQREPRRRRSRPTSACSTGCTRGRAT